MKVENNVKDVLDRIAQAAVKSGREPSEITLVAVSKFVEPDRIIEAYEVGLRHFGENRVQELVDKTQLLEKYSIKWHFIGQLQTNKVKYLDERVLMVQSADRLELITKLDDAMARRGMKMPVLVQVNIGGEPQKGGINEDDVLGVIGEFGKYPNLTVRGLMCIPPNIGSENTRYYFKRMHDCFKRVQDAGFSHAEMKMLSMGMSGDFEAAIEEGSNMVRVGSAIFGERY